MPSPSDLGRKKRAEPPINASKPTTRSAPRRWKFCYRRHPAYQPLAEVFGETDPFLEALVEIDALLAEMIEAAGSGALIIVMGAWGHRLEHTTVHLNRLLEREGYLRFRRGPASQVKHGLFRLGLTVERAEQLAHRLNLWKRFHYRCHAASGHR